MTRDEHLAWAKERALAYLNEGNLKDAVASMMSDLDKHAETRMNINGVGAALGLLGIQCVLQHDIAGARRWIEGFR